MRRGEVLARLRSLLGSARFPIGWWMALCLLVLNDHWFKTSGAVPAWLTGKLSDVAGLVVAPVALCALLQAETTRRRLIAFALVLAPFLALNVSESLARAVNQLTAWAGFPMRVWSDPLDLLALLVLPYSWQVARRSTCALDDPMGRRWPRRTAVTIASLACLATSVAPPETTQCPPFVVNWTRTPVVLDITAQADPTCGATGDAGTRTDMDGGVGGASPPAMLRREVRLETAESVGFGYSAADDGVPLAKTCGTAVVQVRGGPSMTVRWSETIADDVEVQGCQAPPTDETDFVSEHDAIILERAVTVAGAARSPWLVVGERLRAIGDRQEEANASEDDE